MTTPILNKVSFTNVPGGLGLLDRVRTTAVSWGWTQVHWHDAQVVNYTTDAWEANANGGFLCLTSPGQGGSQNLIARLELAKHRADDRYDINIGMSSTTTLDLTSAKRLFYQDVVACDNYRDYSTTWPEGEQQTDGLSLPTTNILEVWIIGNDQYIYVCANLDGVFHTMMEFGSYQQRDPAPTAQNGSMTSTVKVGRDALWSTYTGYTPQGVAQVFGIPSLTGPYYYPNDKTMGWKFTFAEGLKKRTYFYDSFVQGIQTSDIYFSLEAVDPYTLSHTYSINQCFTEDYIKCLTPGDSSGRRFMMRNTFMYKRDVDGLVIPASESFASFFNGQGLQPAQSIFYGSDEYIVFPCCSILAPIWIAFRIA